MSEQDMQDRAPDFTYIIFSVDLLSHSEQAITEMSPASHMPAGYREDSPEHAARTAIAAKFCQTEGNEQYDFGYLGKHGGSPRYFPYGTLDSEGTGYPDDDYEGEAGEGQHRKWVAELTMADWRVFADAYLIDLDEDGQPAEYEETMGSLTEHGHLAAVAIDMREGWEDGSGTDVIDAQAYVSFGGFENPDDARDSRIDELEGEQAAAMDAGTIEAWERSGRAAELDSLRAARGFAPADEGRDDLADTAQLSRIESSACDG